jgi:hypothetical protein
VRWLVVAMIAGCGHSSGSTGDGSPGDDSFRDDGAGPDGGGCPAATPCPSGQWCVETAPIAATTLVHGVFAVSTDDVFAVGDAGTILHRRCGTWSTMASGTTMNLRGVWGTSAKSLWVVGQGATILHYDGTSWTPMTNTSGVDLFGVWGASASDIWAIGSQTVVHFDGQAWTTAGLTGDQTAIAGTGPTDVWTSAENGYLHHFDGTWHLVDPGFHTSIFYAVWPVAANDVWASMSATSNSVVHDTGTWAQQTLAPGVVFQALWGSAANDVWGVSSTTVGHWAGSSWTTERPTGLTQPLWGIHGVAGEVWLVGDGATILHRN